MMLDYNEYKNAILNKETRVAYNDWQASLAMVGFMNAMVKRMFEMEESNHDRFFRLRLDELKTMPYKKYLESPEWQETRKKALIRSDDTCQKCGAKGVELHVHHLTYERRGEELPEDLIVLCKDCHKKEHGL